MIPDSTSTNNCLTTPHIGIPVEKASINALPGLCKPVTDGWDCEQYDYHQGLLISKRVNKFYSCLHFSNGKLIKNNLPRSNKEVVLMKVIEISKKIADHFGNPQDIEWTYYKEKIFILQSRPISRSIWREDQNNMKDNQKRITFLL